MPMMTVQYPVGSLSFSQKDALAEDLTRVIVEIEGGADTPEGRSIAWVRFHPFEQTDWYIGGHNDGTFEAAGGRWLIELNVPEGSMSQERKSNCHQAITKAILVATGHEGSGGAASSIWIQIFEWPEGHLATGGRTSNASFGTQTEKKRRNYARLAQNGSGVRLGFPEPIETQEPSPC